MYTRSYRSIRLSQLLKHFKLSLFLKNLSRFSFLCCSHSQWHSFTPLPPSVYKRLRGFWQMFRCSHLDEKGEGREKEKQKRKTTLWLWNALTHSSNDRGLCKIASPTYVLQYVLIHDPSEPTCSTNNQKTKAYSARKAQTSAQQLKHPRARMHTHARTHAHGIIRAHAHCHTLTAS